METTAKITASNPVTLAYSLSRGEWAALAAELRQPAFRARQAWEWLYAKGAQSFGAMTTLPAELRQSLASRLDLSPWTAADSVADADGTRKLLLECHDGERIESVIIPSSSETATLCVSTQAGCAFGCAFCATGKCGFDRNLEAGEIVGQLMAARAVSPLRIDHIVFMGMGEPFANYENTLKAVRIFNDGDGLAIGARRMTLSTCGVVPGIRRLAGEGLQVELAVSLHAPNDALRSRIMPVNKRWPLQELIGACRDYNAATKRIVTFEYTLVEGLNDTRECAAELGALLDPSFARVNLIPLSPVPHFDGRRPAAERCAAFASILRRHGLNATLRRSKGTSVTAACGQLKLGRQDCGSRPAAAERGMARPLPAAMAICAAMALAGCAVGPDYATPDPGHVPESLPAAVAAPESADSGSGCVAESGDSWYDGFGDPSLSSLIGIASTNSLDILQILKRIDASRAALSGARAEFWPKVGFAASTSKAKSYNPDSDTERSSARFDASWELDIFGKVRRSSEAARAELEAAEFGLTDALVSLRAEIAAEYANLRLRQELLAIIRDNLGIQREFADIAKAKFDAGFAPELDWLSAESQLRVAEASIPSSEADAQECIRRLELLCSLAPGALDGMLAPAAPLPQSPALPTAVPSDLLRRRPDVRRAERNYAAALARIGVAKANYFPSVSIGAGFALSTDSFASWGDAVRSIDFGPSLSWSLLSFGRTRAKVAQARAAAEEAALAYRSAVLSAFHEVEDAAIGLDRDLAREAPLAAAVEAQRAADALALKMYREDLGEYRDVLTSRQSLLSLERSLAELRANLVLSKIALCKALSRL